MIKRYFILSILIACFYGAIAQDIHFSQHYHTPLLVNPALTGFYEENMRVLINYKDQWRSVASPYKTMAFSYDMPILRDKWDNNYLGAGLSVYNDRVAKYSWGLTQVNLSLSSIITLNARNKLSGGFQGGVVQHSFNSADLKWDSQFDGQNYDASLSTGETQLYDSKVYGDLAAGIAWAYTKKATNITSNDHFKTIIGASLDHVNRPVQNRFSKEESKLYPKFAAHVGMYIGIKNTKCSVVPSLLFMKQGSAQEFSAGALVRYKLQEASKFTGNIKGAAILIGGHYRFMDAIIPLLMIEVANFALGISYDINTSGLTNVSNGQGGMEISLRFVIPSQFQSGGSVLF